MTVNRILKMAILLLSMSTGLAPAHAVAAETSATAAPVPDDYVIGPGDTLNVLVVDNPNLSLPSVSVRPDGKVTTPLANDVVAVGKSPTQLARDIESVLLQFLRNPQVTIVVVNAVSALSQVQVVGQVREQRALPYRKGLRVLDAVLAVGGMTDFARPNAARIVRNVNGKEQEIKVRLGDLLNKGDMKQNLELSPGDVLIVPQSLF